ncbi:L-threonylcarbamoyladenylate synthase [Roseivirga pacifica]|uniref:L-threonylcarbamoyladenylate synthase n=1 Tax=Roseivirga pacifica TaxID=1267423 RepID=UPI0020951D7C|nr:L-threonylcarbamoyladenylate synthase [Roseivirga pacifica]MCO6358244.1 threonylcarbamoyl-AMP synthase [Roseivirga pacifica]MCO6366292.1 threonylcarbamoyl-AMP synthase [Roseivirga pacifica]MCO6369157.1 threonylcarbamoyl-AMP synthase [Roseivirga pacifica]MCO6373975.1 threonylcarbamoyl-AMP synthase [Roseivirga pacifica]MCO6378351.1 threonylcarbamoyl-AMP synthase [Roseivirga pacifica]
MAKIGDDIALASEILNNGGLVAMPTETVYGLAGNALNLDAVHGIFEAKQRPSFDPLIVHTNSLEKVEGFVAEIPQKAKLLADAYWPGPLTLLLEKQPIIPDLVTSGLNTVAIRMPKHPVALALLENLDFPLAAPSANPFGYVSPTTAEHVNNQLGEKIDYILDGGECTVGIESTIVSFENEVPKVLRLGGLSVEDIEEVVGPVEVAIHSSSKPSAPGMLKSHYAPSKTIVLFDDINLKDITDFSEFGSLVFDQPYDFLPLENQFVLSKSGDMAEAAKNLFSGLRILDQKPQIHTIITQFVPNEGLGRAINDRIKRATVKS